MPENTLVNSAVNTVADTIEEFYTAGSSSEGGAGTLITAFSATNDSGASASYKAYIFDVTETVLDPVQPQTIVVRDKFSLGPSVVGQLIPPGGSLRMQSSTAGAISFRVTGDEL